MKKIRFLVSMRVGKSFVIIFKKTKVHMNKTTLITKITRKKNSKR